MRLIDADALIDKYQREDSVDVFRYEVIKDLDNAPTVDVIPIKWLTAQADNPSNSDMLRNAIDYIVYTLWAERKEDDHKG